MTKRGSSRTQAMSAFVLMSLLTLGAPLPAVAQEVHAFNIVEQDSASAIRAFGEQSGLQILASAVDLQDKKLNPVSGNETTEEALADLLAGTGLGHRYVADRAVALVSKSESKDEELPDRLKDAPLGAPSKQTGGTPDTKTGFFDRLRLAQVDRESPRRSTSASNDSQDSATHPDSRSQLEEITVTATKREQKLQDVPFGISALNTEGLEHIGAKSAQDYLANVPGAYFSSRGRGLSPIIMRGISTEGNNINNLQRTTEYYVDEVPLLDRFSTWVGIDLNTFDIERVEVLRGPQGTLFGSGAMGGAVRVITNKPDATNFGAKFELGQAFTYGGDQSNNMSGMINMPLVSDKLAARFVGYVDNTGGWIDNVRRHAENVNHGRVEGGRLMLRYTPDEKLDVLLSVIREDTNVNDSDRSFRNGPSDQWDGLLQEPFTQSLTAYNLTVNYDFGPVKLTSASTFAQRTSLLDTNFSVAIQSLFPNHPIDPGKDKTFIVHPSHRFTQEVRLVSNDNGRLDWTVGAFFMKFNTRIHEEWDIDAPPVPTDITVPLAVRETAGFGEATYRLTDKFHVTAGARYFSNVYQTEIISKGTVIQVPAPFTEIDSHGITPKFSLSYYPVPDLHLYTTASKGYRVGQANFSWAADPRIPKGYNPDSLWNYELGMKGSFRENLLKVNLAGFYIDWSDLQLQRFVILPGSDFPLNYTDNAGKARIKGVEADFAFRPFQNWEIGSAFTYLDAKLKSVLPNVTLIPGSTLPGSPKFTIASYIQYTSQLPNNMDGYIRLGHRYVGKVYFDINNATPDSTSDAYQVFDLRTGIHWDKYELAFYASNLTNNTESIVAADLLNGLPLGGAFRLRPRTIGATVRVQF